MNGIIILGCVLCLMQISSSVSTHGKIAEDGSLVQRKDVHGLQLLQRNKRQTRKIYVVFDNRSGRLIELWWKERGMKKQPFTSLAPGAVLTTSTYLNHEWLATDKTNKEMLLVNNKKTFTPKRNALNTRDRVIIKRQGQKAVENGEKYIETMVVVDKSFLEYHKTTEDVKRYVSLLLKLASNVLQHPSLSETFGVKITVVLSKLVLLKDDKKEIVIKQYNNFRDGGKNLYSVCTYMNKIGNSGPVQFDHKLFLTRTKFGFSGYGERSGMCSQSRSCSLVLDAGFSSAIVIAHEIGHVLGTDDHNYGGDSSYVMAKPVTARLNNHKWSAESKVFILQNLRRYHCLDNKPSLDNFATLYKYPGIHYSPEKQCQFEYSLKHSFWSKSDHCVELRCKLPKPFDNYFYKTESPALDGTECGTNKWCLSGSCQTKSPTVLVKKPIPRTSSRPRRRPIHGNWGVWKVSKHCTKTCGSGISTRVRECNNPRPRNGGRYCVGRPIEVLICKIKDCPSIISKEDSLCAKEATKRDPTRKWGFYDENKVNLNCDFETDTCSWKNEKFNDQQDWILNKGKTPSAGTGPLADHTKKIKQGQYIYFESSSPTSKPGYNARLSSPVLAVRQGCLTFWYHMHGDTKMGSLRVTKSSRGTTRHLWVKTGNQGKKWLQQQLEIEDDNLYQIGFVAKKDFTGFRSDIALDSITFTPGRCGRTNKVERKDICTVTCTTIDNKSPKKIIKTLTNDGRRQRRCRTVGCDGVLGSGKKFDSCNVCGGNGRSCKSPSNTGLKKQENVVNCDFEKDSCQWSNQKNGNELQWLRRKGVSRKGYYMFVESFNREPRARKYITKMLSPKLNIPKACLSFDYKMDGRYINKLKLRLVVKTRIVPGLRWTKKGHQGRRWLRARVELRTTTLPYQIVIEAVVRNRRHGNVAIDNIQFRRGSCR